MPQFVEREFREFLLCGVFEAGVARFRCSVDTDSCRPHSSWQFCPIHCSARVEENFYEGTNDLVFNDLRYSRLCYWNSSAWPGFNARAKDTERKRSIYHTDEYFL